MAAIKSCPYYMEDEIIKNFPMRQCEGCPNQKYTDDEDAVMYCAVASDPVAVKHGRNR